MRENMAFKCVFYGVAYYRPPEISRACEALSFGALVARFALVALASVNGVTIAAIGGILISYFAC